MTVSQGNIRICCVKPGAYLRQSQIDGHRFGDVQEPTVSGDGQRKAVQRLKCRRIVINIQRVHKYAYTPGGIAHFVH